MKEKMTEKEINKQIWKLDDERKPLEKRLDQINSEIEKLKEKKEDMKEKRIEARYKKEGKIRISKIQIKDHIRTTIDCSSFYSEYKFIIDVNEIHQEEWGRYAYVEMYFKEDYRTMTVNDWKILHKALRKAGADINKDFDKWDMDLSNLEFNLEKIAKALKIKFTPLKELESD